MQPDPERVAAARAWVGRAANDLRAATHMLAADPPLVGDALFHAQQVAEKAMKAFLTWHDVPFRKTHDLGEIGRQCVEVDPALEQLCVRAERLTVFAWIFRYPGDPAEPPPEEAREAIALARELYDTILAQLPAEVRP